MQATPRASSRLLLLCILSLGAVRLPAQNLLPNGSFEDGGFGLAGWAICGETSISANQPHGGQRCVFATARKWTNGCVSDAVPVTPQADYRLEGWIRTSKGSGRMDLQFLDAGGKVVQTISSRVVSGAKGWQYVALELNAGTAVSARVNFMVRGEAELDDVVLAPVAASFIGNKGVQGDDRGRIPMWTEEQSDTLVPGRRAGKIAVDSAIKKEGVSSARIVAEGDWCALSSINYPLPGWTERLEFSGWIRTDGAAAQAQLLACWTDDAQKILRVDAGKPVSGPEWQRACVVPDAPPASAANVRLVALTRGGTAWFDEFDIVRLAPRQRRIRIFANQIGYELAGPKTAIIAANFLPGPDGILKVRLVTPRGRAAWKRDVECAGRVLAGTTNDWGWYFWRADFSEFKQAGEYRVETHTGAARGETPVFKIEPDIWLRETAQTAVDFFFIQRCGFTVPGWHKACHLDDARLPDGTHLNAIGGWHSAGDYNKLMYENGDGGVVYALMTAQAAAPQIFNRFDRDRDNWCDALDEAAWGAAFVARMQIPETGGLRNHVHQGPGRNWTKWSAPEDHTDNQIGTADDPVIQPGDGNSPLAVAGWAQLSMISTQRGRTNDYLTRAVQLWKAASRQGQEVSSPHLLLGALALHRVTAETNYLDYASRSAKRLVESQSTNAGYRGAFGDYGEVTAGALATFALAQPSSPLRPQIEQALREYIAFCQGTARNPFGLGTRSGSATNGFFPPDLGNNFQLLMRAWAASLAARVTAPRSTRSSTGQPGALSFAADQMDWVFGKNPVGLCMFEGKGTFNPPRYHHRYNVIAGHERGAVPGTIPNGFVRELGLADRPGFDLSRAGGRAPSFRTSEPWLVHNMWYLLAISAWHDAMADCN